VKSINLRNALYHSGEVSLPLAFEIVKKPYQFCDIETRKVKRASEVTKNKQLRDMVAVCIENQLKFNYVLMECWFSAKDNCDFIVKKKKHCIAALKDNRLVALSGDDKKNSRFVRIDTLPLTDKQAVRGWLKGYEKEVLLVRQIFTHKDGSTACLNLVCSDLTCDGQQATTLYKKRWKVEEFHKSLKSHCALAKSPTRTTTTQNNHVFMSIFAVFKLGCLKLKHKANHFALRVKIFIGAFKLAFAELQVLRVA
jgi:hypothetical protein